ncbi:MAG: PEP/pyruvate-binding domain-containing protein [Candidatus Nanoarchaeia archaeon]|nr:PEP/pyruvate-binding domain-containing protein [Candidatus Nanoarchaeia archaeon]
MSFSIPLKRAIEVDKFTVGQKAINFAVVENYMNIPFSMVITTEAFDEFVTYNQLGPELDWFKKATNLQDKVASFERLVTHFKNSQFPQYVVDALQECYELVSLDTNNLHNLSVKNQSQGLLMLTRSLNQDEDLASTPKTFFTKETFKQFIETIKKTYISAFTPDAVLQEDSKIAVIVSRVPALKTTIETEYDLNKSKIYVRTYYGFPDFSEVVEKDEFIVNGEFLKIEKSGIQSQKRASVFDSTKNMLSVGEFKQENSSQNVADSVILEVARLTKTISKTMGASFVRARFFAAERIECVDIDCIFGETDFEEKTIEETVVEDSKIDLDSLGVKLDSFEKKEKLHENINEFEFKNFLEALKMFMEKYKSKELASSVPILVRSLEQPNKNSIHQSLEICKEIISNFNEDEE